MPITWPRLLPMAATRTRKKKKRARKKQHGGRRPGSGRKPLEGIGAVKLNVSLLPSQVEKVEQWRDGLGRQNFSAALREIIDAAPSSAAHAAPPTS